MATEASSKDPTFRNDHTTSLDHYGQKFVEKTEKLHDKTENAHSHDKKSEDEKKPAGGFDGTPVPKAPAGYTLKFTFHSAKNLPFADISLTSDPYIAAVLKTSLQKRHKQDSDVTLRTPTIHRNVNPVWNTSWVIAHVPASGFQLKARLYDEDPADHDDRLGNVHVDVGRIDDKWSGFKEKEFTIKKRMGSKRAYTLRGCAALVSRNINMSGTVTISVENLGRSEGDGGRAYTVGPLLWKQHYSPLIGRLTGIKDGDDSKTSKYNFQAIQMQLKGPVPEGLYHRYVEFKPFVAGMFTSHTLRGRVLNHALHHQHARIYNYDTSTKYGTFQEPSIEMTRKFLEFVHYDQGGRIFTYVITLDGQMRFTETGKEFGIDMLSKHTMHSDVSIYIAFSGEFFIRRIKQRHNNNNESDGLDLTELMSPGKEPDEKGNQSQRQGVSKASSSTAYEETTPRPATQHSESRGSNLSDGKSNSGKQNPFNFFHRDSRSRSASNGLASPQPTRQGSEVQSKEPSNYELIIDNDSGTYRPNAKYLPDLKKFLAGNFPGLKVGTLDCQKDEEKMKKLKKEQAERKKNSGKQITYMQNSSQSSLSSSDEEELARRAGGKKAHGPKAVVQKEWQKVKGLGKGDGVEEKEDDDTKDQNKNVEIQHQDQPSKQAEEYDEKRALEASNRSEAMHHHQNEQQQSHNQNPYVISNTAATNANAGINAETKKQSVSTDADHRSFDTAYTDPQHNHFVTPKASLGNGGLNQFDAEGRDTSNTQANAHPANANRNSTIHSAVTVSSPTESNGPGFEI